MSTVDTTTNAGQLLATASGGRRRQGDRIFSNAAVIAAVTILALLAGVAAFLVGEGLPALTASSTSFRVASAPASRIRNRSSVLPIVSTNALYGAFRELIHLQS